MRTATSRIATSTSMGDIAVAGIRRVPVYQADRPRRAADAIECDVRDELLVYGPARDAAMALNASARAIWQLCDGARSTADIAAALAAPLGLPSDALEEDVRSAVDEFRRAGLIDPEAST